MKYTLEVNNGICKITGEINSKIFRIEYIGSPLWAKEIIKGFLSKQ
jgi:hypothetical protein